MIKLLDKNGKPLGLDYDYEYRGKKCEKYRDAPLVRFKVTWYIFIGLFSFGGVFVLFQYFIGKSNGTLGQCLISSLGLIAIAALLYYILRKGLKKHSHLMAIIYNHKFLNR